MPLEVDKKQLAILKRFKWEPYGAEGWMPTSWADVVLGEWNDFDPPLPVLRHDRATLRVYCRNPTTPPFHAFIAVMAWGGQSPRSGKYRQALKVERETIAELVCQLRAGKQRDEAYDLWRNKVWGLGPSFFTKLLCFLSPTDNMAIMDQWAVKSVNLLFGCEVVRLAPCARGTLDTSPCKSNAGQDYERYCRHLEHLQNLLEEETLSSTEERIFSRLIKGQATWRSHVKETWMPYSRHRPSLR